MYASPSLILPILSGSSRWVLCVILSIFPSFLFSLFFPLRVMFSFDVFSRCSNKPLFTMSMRFVQTWWQITGHSNHLAFGSLLCLHDLLTGCHLKSDVEIVNSISPSFQSARDHRSAQSHNRKLLKNALWDTCLYLIRWLRCFCDWIFF